MRNEEQQAKQEISEAYVKAKEAGAIKGEDCQEGLEFGRLCVKWHDWYQKKERKQGDRIRFMWKALGIPHTAAYHWMGIARQKFGLEPPIIEYTKEELERTEQKAINENNLVPLFKDCGFKYDIKQNCATRELHFNVVFSSLNETEVKQLAAQILRGKE